MPAAVFTPGLSFGPSLVAFAVEKLRIDQKAGDFADAIRERVVRSFGKVVVRVSRLPDCRRDECATKSPTTRREAPFPRRHFTCSELPKNLFEQAFNLLYALFCIILTAVTPILAVHNCRKRFPMNHLRSDSRRRLAVHIYA